MSRSEGGSPAATTAEPSAAIIAPLSVQYRIGGMRRVMPASANRSAASSRSRLLAENPPPTTTVPTPRLVAAASVLVTSTSATASEKEAAMSAAGTCAPASSNPSTTDRKSTRLNSSHVAISYAVFCFKKKQSKNYRHYLCAHTFVYINNASSTIQPYTLSLHDALPI